MKDKPGKPKKRRSDEDTPEEDYMEGYPPYSENEDIYGKYQKEKNIDPEDPFNIMDSFELYKPGRNNEKDFDEDMTGDDLDIPGSELDDDLEFTGSEDEENNYYSLGGDDHNDLDEDHVEE